MKVYELMDQLKNAPAGMDVLTMDRAGTESAGEIQKVEIDGNNSEGIVTIFYHREKE